MRSLQGTHCLRAKPKHTRTHAHTHLGIVIHKHLLLNLAQLHLLIDWLVGCVCVSEYRLHKHWELHLTQTPGKKLVSRILTHFTSNTLKWDKQQFQDTRDPDYIWPINTEIHLLDTKVKSCLSLVLELGNYGNQFFLFLSFFIFLLY